MTSATTTLTDEQIQREVLAELKWDSRLQPNEIGVAVKDGVVTLTGARLILPAWTVEPTCERDPEDLMTSRRVSSV